MSNKKTVLAAGVALAVVAYAGATWYMGQKAQASYQQGVAELRELVGEQAIASDEYHKGFFSSQARLVVQWDQPASADGAEAGRPLRLAVDSSLRHGPLAGVRLAAAVIHSRFSLEGLDGTSAQVFAKATGPTLTAVRHLTGGSDIRLLLPAGEIGDDEMRMSWQEMVLDATLGADRHHYKGSLRWPEFMMAGLPRPLRGALDASRQELDDGEDAAEGEDGQEMPRHSPAFGRSTITLSGMEGSFDTRVLDGLWGMGPGTTRFRIARVAASTQPVEGGEAKTVVDVRDVVGQSVVEADKDTLGMTTEVKGAGRLGPFELESIGYEEKVQRIDIEALRSFQRALLEGYRVDGLADAFEIWNEEASDLLAHNAPRLVAALPAYSMKLQATYQGHVGHIAYGAQIQSEPDAEEVAMEGWIPALLKTTALHADARLPKAWLEPILKAKISDVEVKTEDVNVLVGRAQASGYVRLDGEHLTSALKMEGGQLTLNGKPISLPGMPR